MSRDLLESVEFELQEFEEIITRKKSILTHILNENDQENINKLISQVRTITQHTEFQKLKHTIIDFKSLKEALREKQSNSALNLLKSLETNLDNLRQAFEQEIQEELQEQEKDRILREIKRLNYELEIITSGREELASLRASQVNLTRSEEQANISEEEFEKRKKQLYSWSFTDDPKKLKYYKNFLESHFSREFLIPNEISQRELYNLCTNKWQDILKIQESIENKLEFSEFCRLGLPIMIRYTRLNPLLWDELAKLLITLESESPRILIHGLQEIKPFIILNPKILSELSKVIETEKPEDKEILFVKSIPRIFHFAKDYPDFWPEILWKLIKASKESSSQYDFFDVGIPRAMIVLRAYPELMDRIISDLVTIYQNAGGKIGSYLLSPGKFKPNLWPMIVGFSSLVKKGINPVIFREFVDSKTLKYINEDQQLWDYILKLIETFPREILKSDKGFRFISDFFRDAGPTILDYVIKFPQLKEEFLKLARLAHISTPMLFYNGIGGLMPYLNQKQIDNFSIEVSPYFIEIIERIPDNGTLDEIFSSLRVSPLLKKFGLTFFSELISPIIKAQGVATSLFLVKLNFFSDKYRSSIESLEDLRVIRTIATKYKYIASDILTSLLSEGLSRNCISEPLSKEKDILLFFLENSPTYIVELYINYKNILSSQLSQEKKNKEIQLLFSKINSIKQNIKLGELKEEVDEELLIGILFSTFPPELTISRDLYKKNFENNNDRQEDIPKILIDKLSGKTVKLSKGGYVLSQEINIQPWKPLANSVQSITENKINFTNQDLGFEILQATLNNQLEKYRDYFIDQIYYFSVHFSEHQEALPMFNSERETVLKYKEFVEDRLNDKLFEIFSLSMQKNSQEFTNMKNQILGKEKPEVKGLSNTLSNVLDSKKEPHEKENILQNILQNNGFYIEDALNTLERQKNIEQFLLTLNQNIIEKGLISIVVHRLYGENIKLMEKEMEKYKFEKTKKGILNKSKKYSFVFSKKKLHSVAMFNMGVCIAPDLNLWNSPDFWQLIIFDEENNANGGVIFRTIEEDSKKYLILSINPSSLILSKVAPEQLYDKILQFAKLVKKILKYDSVLIPMKKSIHSNRGSIQSIISSKNYKKITLNKNYNFSYKPYSYDYQTFFLVE